MCGPSTQRHGIIGGCIGDSWLWPRASRFTNQRTTGMVRMGPSGMVQSPFSTQPIRSSTILYVTIRRSPSVDPRQLGPTYRTISGNNWFEQHVQWELIQDVPRGPSGPGRTGCKCMGRQCGQHIHWYLVLWLPPPDPLYPGALGGSSPSKCRSRYNGGILAGRHENRDSGAPTSRPQTASWDGKEACASRSAPDLSARWRMGTALLFFGRSCPGRSFPADKRQGLNNATREKKVEGDHCCVIKETGLPLANS